MEAQLGRLTCAVRGLSPCSQSGADSPRWVVGTSSPLAVAPTLPAARVLGPRQSELGLPGPTGLRGPLRPASRSAPQSQGSSAS